MMVSTPKVAMFSTEQVPDGQRLRHWEQHNEQSLMSFNCSVDEGKTFLARQLQIGLHRLRFIQMHGSGHSIGRTAATIGAKPANVLFLCLLDRGQATHEQRGAVEVIRPGDGILYDPDEPFEYGFARDMNQAVIEIPRGLFREMTGQVGLLRARVFRGDRCLPENGLGRLARAVQRSIREPTTALGQEEAVLGILEGMLPRIHKPCPGGHLKAAIGFIDENASCNDLSVPHIAHALGISPRHLSRVFVADGRGVASFVRDTRLGRAHALLMDPAHAAKGIGEIAASAGFPSPAHFARAFKARYGYTAREARQGAGAASTN
jgi:AraC-like DNA-binding protein